MINFEKLYDRGYRGIIFDIDNTLAMHGAPADERAVRLFEGLRRTGFDTCLISNNQEPRVKPFADSVKSRYVSNAHKPSVKNYKKAMELMGMSCGPLRMPLTELTKEHTESLAKAMQDYGIKLA